MKSVYKKWPDLTAEQKAEAQKMAQSTGYKPDEIPSLLYGMDGETVISLRDPYLPDAVLKARGVVDAKIEDFIDELIAGYGGMLDDDEIRKRVAEKARV